MVVNYEDGTSETIVSGKDWKYDFSPVLFNCIYGGEDYDARREQKGWNMFGFKEQDWRPVVIQEAPKGVLRPQIAQPVKIMERYDIRKVTKLTAEQITAACKSTKRTVDPSAFVLDMGQNLAGSRNYRPWKERAENNSACIRIPDGRRSLQSASDRQTTLL